MKANKQQARRRHELQKKSGSLERRVNKLQAEVSALESELAAADPASYESCQQKYHTKKEALEELELEWLEALEELDGLG